MCNIFLCRGFLEFGPTENQTILAPKWYKKVLYCVYNFVRLRRRSLVRALRISGTDVLSNETWLLNACDSSLFYLPILSLKEREPPLFPPPFFPLSFSSFLFSPLFRWPLSPERALFASHARIICRFSWFIFCPLRDSGA